MKPLRRGLSARWWGTLSIAVIGAMLLAVAALAALNATRTSGRLAGAAPTPSPPPLLPFSVASPPPSPTLPAGAVPSPSPTGASSTLSFTTASPVPTAPAPRLARITNTGGIGANIRREPATSSPSVAAVPEDGTVRLLGAEQRASDGRLWRQVEDARGNQGWIPADFLVEPAP